MKHRLENLGWQIHSHPFCDYLYYATNGNFTIRKRSALYYLYYKGTEMTKNRKLDYILNDFDVFYNRLNKPQEAQ
jgi:hypothetical protein